MWLLVVILVAVFLYTMRGNIMEGFAAPYYIPWWRRYYQSSPYLYSGKYPYYNGAYYWWPHYGRSYYGRYWRNYGYSKQHN